MLYTRRLCGRSGRRSRQLAFSFLGIMWTGILKISQMIVYNSRERERQRATESERKMQREGERERARERDRHRYWNRHSITHITDRQTDRHTHRPAGSATSLSLSLSRARALALYHSLSHTCTHIRGAHSVEVVTYLLAQKLISPSKFKLLRGNHEASYIRIGRNVYAAICRRQCGYVCGTH